MVSFLKAFNMQMNGKYKPSWFLASVGNGGLAVAFYIFFMTLVPPAKYTRYSGASKVTFTAPIATYEAISTAYKTNNGYAAAIILNYIALAYFAFKHFYLLIWNLVQLRTWWKEADFRNKQKRNEDVGIMTIPLTFAMTINVCFSLGAAFIPRLWEVVEYVFPVSIVLFFLIGFFAIYLFVKYFGDLLVHGGFDCDANRSFSQMLTVFAFSMIGVGFAGPVAMTFQKTTFVFAVMGGLLFLSSAFLLAIPAFVMGLRSMLISGISHESAASLLMVIPIFTLWGISFTRFRGGFYEVLKTTIGPEITFLVISLLFMLQVMFFFLGGYVLNKIGYFGKFILPSGENRSPLVYGMICPFVGTAVLFQFWLNKGLVAAFILEKYTSVYWAIFAVICVVYAVAFVLIELVDFKMIWMHNSAMGNNAKQVDLEKIEIPVEKKEEKFTK